MLANEYKECDWHFGREYANFMNCIRSTGSPQIFCTDMYDVKGWEVYFVYCIYTKKLIY